MHVEKVIPPQEIQTAGPDVEQINVHLDMPINIEGPSNIDKSKKPAEKKKASEVQHFSLSFRYKGKAITIKQSNFESCGVAYNFFTHATLPKDEEVFQQMTDGDLKRDGFHSLLKVNYLFFYFIHFCF